METAIDKYIREHSTAQGEALEWIEKQTSLHTNYPQMLSGAVQGRLLTMLVELTGARDILEIGTFTGYSASMDSFSCPASVGAALALKSLLHCTLAMPLRPWKAFQAPLTWFT